MNTVLARRVQAGNRWIVDDRERGLFRVSRETFTDPEVLKLERDHIFNTCWLYLGHASELKRPNDFVTRSVGGRELIFNRDRQGAFHAFFNTCPHRGAMVAREKCGNALGFQCFYHGWSFNNNGQYATRHAPGTYPPDFNADGCANLVPVPRIDEYRGFYFVNYDAGAESLSDFLAGAKEILDVVSEHSPLGMEIIGGVQEYSIRANWKLLAENSYDAYHAAQTHSTYFEYLAQAINGPEAAEPAPLTQPGAPMAVHDLGNGHACIEGETIWARPIAQWIPAWGEKAKGEIEDIRAELRTRLGEQRAHRIAVESRNMVIFPNLVINDIMAITVRTFYPEAPDLMNVNSWALGPVDESREFRKRRLDNFLEFLGPGGLATPDDIEALESAQIGYRNSREAPWNDISRGMLNPTPGPTDEAQMRYYWREWARRVEGVK